MTGFGLNVKFSSPPYSFYGGGAVASEVPYPYPVGIGGHGYFIDVTKLELGTVDVLRQAYDPAAEPGEQSLSIEGAWKRVQTSWVGGAGQAFLDDPDSERDRFDESYNVDVWNERELCLLPYFEGRTIATVSALAKAGTSLYEFGATFCRKVVDPTVAWTYTSVTSEPAAAVVSTTQDGKTLYAAYGTSGVYTIVGTTATLLSSATTSLVVFANGQLFGANGAQLNVISSGGTVTAVVGGLGYDANFAWAAGAGTSNGVFFGGNHDQRGYFFFVGYDETTGGVTAATPAGALPAGETINTMFSLGDVILIGTSLGFRLAQRQERGLTYGKLVELGFAVTSFDALGEFVWFNWNDGTNSGLGRIRPGRFTDDLVPAWATDSVVAGLATTVHHVVTLGSSVYAGVGTLTAYGTSPTYLAPSGELSPGWITFGTSEDKVATRADIRTEPLSGSVTFTLENELETEYVLGTFSNAGQVAPVTSFSARNLTGEFFRPTLTLTAAGGLLTGPCVRRWTLRSVVAPVPVDDFTVPILLYSRVHDENGDMYEYDPAMEWRWLKQLEASRQEVTLQLGQTSYAVTVRSVRMPAGMAKAWTDDRSFVEGTVMVRMMLVGGE